MEMEQQLTETTAENRAFVVDPNKPLDTQIKNYVNVVATEKVLRNEKVANDITEAKTQELKLNAEANVKSEQASLQKAEYDVYEGIASYAGIKKPLPKLYQKILFTAYMIFLFPVQLLVGTIFCVLNFFADCVDTFMVKIGSIVKSAKVIVVGSLTIGFIAICITILVKVLQFYNIV